MPTPGRPPPVSPAAGRHRPRAERRGGPPEPRAAASRDLEVSLGFYEGALGLHRSREFGQPPHRGVVLFLGGGTELELHEGGGPDPDATRPAGVRLWLQVPDVDLAVAQVVAAGAAPAELPERKPWGLIEAVVHDPDGLPLVLVEVPDDHPLRVDTR